MEVGGWVLSDAGSGAGFVLPPGTVIAPGARRVIWCAGSSATLPGPDPGRWGWEARFGLNPSSSSGVNGASGDFDSDGLTNAQELVTTAPLLAIYPGLLIFATVVACNVLGDALQEAIDPQQAGARR